MIPTSILATPRLERAPDEVERWVEDLPHDLLVACLPFASSLSETPHRDAHLALLAQASGRRARRRHKKGVRRVQEAVRFTQTQELNAYQTLEADLPHWASYAQRSRDHQRRLVSAMLVALEEVLLDAVAVLHAQAATPTANPTANPAANPAATLLARYELVSAFALEWGQCTPVQRDEARTLVAGAPREKVPGLIAGLRSSY